MKYCLTFFLMIFWVIIMIAQKDTLLLSTQLDTNGIKKDSVGIKKCKKTNFWTAPYPSPKKALLLSVILPGAGQAYNKRYWKLPIVAGLVGTFSYLIIDNTKTYRKLQSDYLLILKKEKPVNYPNLSDTSIKFYRDQYRYYLEQSYLWAFVSYAAISVDAFVDAHLKSFDISDDLSIKIKPTIKPSFGSPSIGVGLCFQIK